MPSATLRFGEEILPTLAPLSSDLIVELLAPNTACYHRTEEVAESQKEVTRGQAATNQNEFVQLGHRARSLGVMPHILRPSCEQYRAIVQAGDDGFLLILKTIAELTADKAEYLLENPTPPPPGAALEAPATASPTRGTVLAYGGALHNDVTPRPGRESWSYARRLERPTEGHYVEVDLIVPEYVRDTPAWRAFPWYDAFTAQARTDRTLLMRTGPKSFVLFFPAYAENASDESNQQAQDEEHDER